MATIKPHVYYIADVSDLSDMKVYTGEYASLELAHEELCARGLSTNKNLLVMSGEKAISYGLTETCKKRLSRLRFYYPEIIAHDPHLRKRLRAKHHQQLKKHRGNR